MPTTIQTIKEAEERFGTEFSKRKTFLTENQYYWNDKFETDVKSHIHQTLLAVFESELERHKRQKAIHKEIIATHDIAPFKWHEGRIAEAEDSIFHLTEVINYLKQK